MKHIHTFESFLNESLVESVRRIDAEEIKPGTKFVWYTHSGKKDENEIVKVDSKKVLVKTPDGREFTVERPGFEASALVLERKDLFDNSNESVNEDTALTLYAILAAANATAAVSYALHSAGGGDPITPIQDLKNWWAKRKKDKAVQSIVAKLKDDPEVAAFMSLTNAAQRGKWYKLIEPKLNDEEKQYLRSITKSDFK